MSIFLFGFIWVLLGCYDIRFGFIWYVGSLTGKNQFGVNYVNERNLYGGLNSLESTFYELNVQIWHHQITLPQVLLLIRPSKCTYGASRIQNMTENSANFMASLELTSWFVTLEIQFIKIFKRRNSQKNRTFDGKLENYKNDDKNFVSSDM